MPTDEELNNLWGIFQNEERNKYFNQANRDVFFGVIECPVPAGILKNDNNIDITYTNSDGGRESTVVIVRQ